jgi:hypothetical protein
MTQRFVELTDGITASIETAIGGLVWSIYDCGDHVITVPTWLVPMDDERADEKLLWIFNTYKYGMRVGKKIGQDIKAHEIRKALNIPYSNPEE